MSGFRGNIQACPTLEDGRTTITMKRITTIWIAATLFFVACGSEREVPQRTRQASIRGWILDIEGIPPDPTTNQTPPHYIADTNVYLEGLDKISGSIEDGSFRMFDVPDGTIRLQFQAAGIDDSLMEIVGLPRSGDLVLPGVYVGRGKATLVDPTKAHVRLPGTGEAIVEVASTTMIDGVKIRTYEVPFVRLGDRMNLIPRLEYPDVAPFNPVR